MTLDSKWNKIVYLVLSSVIRLFWWSRYSDRTAMDGLVVARFVFGEQDCCRPVASRWPRCVAVYELWRRAGYGGFRLLHLNGWWWWLLCTKIHTQPARSRVWTQTDVRSQPRLQLLQHNEGKFIVCSTTYTLVFLVYCEWTIYVCLYICRYDCRYVCTSVCM